MRPSDRVFAAPAGAALLLVGLASCGPATPTAEQAFAAIPGPADGRYLSCTDPELIRSGPVGVAGRQLVVRARCRYGEEPTSRLRSFSVVFAREGRRWKVSSLRPLEATEWSRRPATHEPYPGRGQLDRYLLFWIGIPAAVVAILLLAWLRSDTADSFGAATRWYRITRRTRLPHQARSQDSVVSSDFDDRDERLR